MQCGATPSPLLSQREFPATPNTNSDAAISDENRTIDRKLNGICCGLADNSTSPLFVMAGPRFDPVGGYTDCIALGMLNMLTIPELTLLLLGIVVGLGAAIVWLIWEAEQAMSKPTRRGDHAR